MSDAADTASGPIPVGTVLMAIIREGLPENYDTRGVVAIWPCGTKRNILSYTVVGQGTHVFHVKMDDVRFIVSEDLYRRFRPEEPDRRP